MNVTNPAISLEWLIANATGKGVEVAVIDSGVDAKHPDLANKIARCCVVREDDGKVVCRELPPEQATDSFGHGTAVAGIVTTIAPDARIIDVKVLNEFNSCTGDVLIEGVRWALDQHIKVINMSLATSKEESIPKLFELCEQAYVQDAIIVASRRNLGDMGCPAMFSSVVSVDREEFDDRYRIRFNPNNLIEYDAAGTDIRVPAPGGGYTETTGTSFATPHVTGLVALLVEVMPGLLPVEAKAILKSLSKA